MPDYRKMYLKLAGQVSDAMDILQNALLKSKRFYIEHDIQNFQLAPNDEVAKPEEE